MKKEDIPPLIGLSFVILAFANLWICPNGASWLLGKLPAFILRYSPEFVRWLNELALTPLHICWIQSIFMVSIGCALLYGSK